MNRDCRQPAFSASVNSPSHDAAGLALGAVVDEGGALAHLVGPLGQGGRLRGQHRGVHEVRVALTEGLVLDVADQPAVPRPVLRRRALDRGGTTDDGLGLDVGEQLLRAGGDQRVRGPGGPERVRVGPGPGVVVSERGDLRRLRPQRQRVVGEVVVQVHQPGDHQRTADVDDRCAVRSGRAGRGALRDGDDPVVIPDPDATGEDTVLTGRNVAVAGQRDNAALHCPHESQSGTGASLIRQAARRSPPQPSSKAVDSVAGGRICSLRPSPRRNIATASP